MSKKYMQELSTAKSGITEQQNKKYQHWIITYRTNQETKYPGV